MFINKIIRSKKVSRSGDNNQIIRQRKVKNDDLSVNQYSTVDNSCSTGFQAN